jgi:flagellar hook assembly protein FlgD
MRSQSLILACTLGLAFSAASAAAGQTTVGGTLTANSEWTAGGGPYIAAHGFSIAAGVTLTVDPGVMVELGSGQSVIVAGTLNAIGSSASPIVFTSTSGTPAGSWGSINFNSGSSGRFSFVTVSYAGSASSSTAGAIDIFSGTGGTLAFDNLKVSGSGSSGIYLYGTASALTLSDSTITGSAYYGVILVNGSTAGVSATAFTGNGAYALSVDGSSALTGLTGLSATANGGGAKNGIEYRGGAISGAQTWPPGLDWYMTASPSTTAASALTLGAGAVLHFAPNQGMNISGNLTAIGTSGSPILFTSMSGTSPGSWNAIVFNNGSSGHLSYVTVSYGGAGGYSTTGAVNVNSGAGGTVGFDNLTITASASSGIVVNGSSAALTLTNSTISASAFYGLMLLNGGGASVTESVFNNNGAYPLSTAAGCPLSGLTAITASGNGSGRNGIEHRGGVIAAPATETWLAVLPWYLTGGLGVNPGATLSLSPGLVVNVAGGQSISVAGTLSAQGTVAAPIAFLSPNPTPYPGIWNGITFSTGSSGQVAYTSLSYAGFQVSWAAPTFDHVTVSNAPNYGFNVSGPPTPVINNCALLANVRGVGATSSVPVDSRLTYWGAASGPSGSGPGKGLSVSASVLFEPWLVAAPSSPQYFSSFAQTDRTFNPVIGTKMTLNFTTALSGIPTALIKSSGGTVVRTFTGAGAAASFAWDGTNNAGVSQPAGTYSYEVDSTSSSGAVATSAVGTVVLDPARQLAVTGLAISPLYFSPNGDGVQDTATLSGTVSFDDGWTLQIINSAGSVIRTVAGTGSAMSWTWNGLDGNSLMAPDGVYTLQVTATAGTSTTVASASVTLDNTPPTVSLTSPTSGQLLANIHQANSAVIQVTGSAADLNLASWIVEYSSSASPGAWNALQSGASAVSGLLATWNTLPLPNGTYNLRLYAADLAGNVSQQTAVLILGNFSAAENSLLVSAVNNLSVTYTSLLPFPVTETLQIKNAAGTVVRTLVNAVARNAGTYLDIWNGLGDGGNLLPDGPYFYVVILSDNTATMTWDLTTQYLNNFISINDNLNIPGYNPFNNSLMAIAYNFGAPGMVTIAVGPTPNIADNCSPPQYCILHQQYDDGRPHTIFWAGVDNTGTFLPGIIGIAAVSERSAFSANAVVSYGTLPQIAALNVEPAVFGPAAGPQNVGFVLSTYQNKPVDVAITFQNQSSLSILRTVTATGIAPGIVQVPWDGTADNGMLVAPGFYTVTVTVTDAAGNQVTGQILTTVEY